MVLVVCDRLVPFCAFPEIVQPVISVSVPYLRVEKGVIQTCQWRHDSTRAMSVSKDGNIRVSVVIEKTRLSG
jgi:hypothetical protein